MPWSDEAVEAALETFIKTAGAEVAMRAALEAADAVRSRTEVVVPREPTDEMVSVAAKFQGGYDPIDMRQLLREAIAAGGTSRDR